jgi:hypothetical protein
MELIDESHLHPADPCPFIIVEGVAIDAVEDDSA